METPDEVRGGGLDHDPPQHWYGICIDPHFYSSSAARPLSPIGSVLSLILLLRAAVDMEVHGGWIEALSVTNGVTLRQRQFSSRRQRAERG